MANKTDTNPMVLDSAAAIWTSIPGASYSHGPKYVRLIQWIDDAADLTDDDDLVIVINGATITGKIALGANTVNNLCVWQLGPFSPGVPVSNFSITTIDHGVLLVFVD